MEEYIVQYGDTFKTIAKAKLDDEKRWYEIAKLNNIESPYQLYIGIRINLPNKMSANKVPPPMLDVELQPATIIPARGFIFVVFEQLPEVGSKNVPRKVQVIPTDFSLKPKNPLANYSLAEHARLGNVKNTQLLSVSEKPYGSPTMGKLSLKNPEGHTEVLLINNSQAMTKGSRIYDVSDVVADLRRYASITNPDNIEFQNSIKTLIRTIENVEGEGMIKGGVHGDAVKKVSTAQTPYIETADEIWAARKAGKITLEQAEEKLATLAKAYERARIVGKVGRVLTVVGAVFTAVDMGVAGKESYDKGSLKPLAAESVRQLGGWSGAAAGMIIGGTIGASLGIATGPGAIVFAAGFAIVFGAIGYWRGDVIAGWIDSPENTLKELRKDVNHVEGLKYRDITVTVGTNERQYDVRRRALDKGAREIMKEVFKIDLNLPGRFVENLATITELTEKKNAFQLGWIKNADGTVDNNRDENSDGLINNETEWKKVQGKTFTYRMAENEVNVLINMMFGLPR